MTNAERRDRFRWRTRVPGLLLVALFAAPGGAQIRLNVSEVVVDVSVRDDDGRFVPGLGIDDFHVFEDGRRQDLTDLQVDPAALSVALVIDTGVDQRSLDSIVAAIPSIVESLADFDEVAVFRYNNEVFRMMDFAEPGAPVDRVFLRQTLDRLADFKAQPDTVAGPELRPGVPPVGGGVNPVPTATIAPGQGRRVLDDAVLEATSALRQRSDERRRTIVLVTGGISERSEADVDDVRLALLDAGVQVFAINLSGGLFGRIMDPLASYASLGSYAGWTGGAVVNANGNDLHAAFSDVTNQARNRYVLTYVSNNAVPPGRIPFREIRVEVPGFDRVSHRIGYYQVP